ncbi:MAG: hypothetical protein ABI624_01120 [Casimicrobiaceae bacterium]
MRISAQFAFWGGVVFAVLCWSYAVYGLTSLDASMTETERADGRGFAMFFVFLGAIGAVMAAVSWLMLRGKIRVPDDR